MNVALMSEHPEKLSYTGLENKCVIISRPSQKGMNRLLISHDIGIRSLKFIIILLIPRNFNCRVQHGVLYPPIYFHSVYIKIPALNFNTLWQTKI